MFGTLEAKLIGAAISALVFALLVGTILFFRGEAIKAKADSATYKANAAQLQVANGEFAKTFARLEQREVENTKLIQTLSEQVQGIDVKTDNFKTDLRKVAANDANVKAFLDQKLPASVLAIVNASSLRNNGSASNPSPTNVH